MDLKNCVVMASGKMRQCAFDKLNSEVQLLGWQQGGRMPKEQFDEWLAQAETLGVKDILEERSATYDSVKQ